MESETKWTPGPWVRSLHGIQVLTGDSWNTICVLSTLENDGRLASWKDGRRATDAVANARLIADAPALYEALQAASGYLLNAKIDLETGAPKRTAIATIEGGLKVVRAALAHARGDAARQEER